MKMKTTQFFWNRFLRGDNQALGELYSDLFEPLVFIAYFKLKNNEQARDIVSDVFVMLLSTPLEERQSKWPNVYAVEGYLAQTVRNKAIDLLRKRERQVNNVAISDEVMSDDPDYFSGELLNRLSRNDHELFQLHLDGFSNTEIAHQHEVTEKTVRNKLSLIRKRIATIYKLTSIFSTWLLLH